MSAESTDSGPGLAVRRYGESALLVEVPDEHVALALVRWVRTGAVACVDAVPAAGTVLLDGVTSPHHAIAALAGWRPTEAEVVPASGGLVTIPVTYDGDDLTRVADLWDVDVDEVVRRHTSLVLVSAFCGFAPGFAYLSGLPEQWSVPRLTTPRTRVPAGSVALADRWCGVYPTSSPGGWLLLGSTRAPVWDLSRSEDDGGPALLAPGTRVRFEAV